MSLHPESIGEVPEQTARVAHAAFPAGNPYLRMRDELESLVKTFGSEFSEAEIRGMIKAPVFRRRQAGDRRLIAWIRRHGQADQRAARLPPSS